jgi:hypothetical protein
MTSYNFKNTSPDNIKIFEKVAHYTMTPIERVVALCEALDYLFSNNIKGGVLECGVWRGGSMMAAALKLLTQKNVERELILVDTFQGMTKPSSFDIRYDGSNAKQMLEETLSVKKESLVWANCDLNTVKLNMGQTGYPGEKIKFIAGDVRTTVPNSSIGQLALLRLDTDWFESTYHELNHLFPKVVKGGVVIIDDYGYWKGAKKAVDRYFSENKINIFLMRIDHSARLGVKQ